jgi:hypothetical protein
MEQENGVLMNRMFRAQAAMEYLMTYGWAILIIAVVLGSLAYLGVFSPSIGNTCTQQSGYLCTGLVYAHAGTMTVTIAEMSGSSWPYYSVGFQSGPQGTLPTVSSDFGPLQSTALMSGVQTTQTFNIGTNAVATGVTVGTPLQGVLWVCWSAATFTVTNGICPTSATVYETQVGIVNTKAQ